jgi:hypothetical protein
MPPRRRARAEKETTAFGRAYPTLQRILLLSCEATPFLTIATILTGTGIWKRPKWQRNILWQAALWSFLSRWVLVGCAVTWTWNEWGRDEDAGDVEVENGTRIEELERRFEALRAEDAEMGEEVRREVVEAEARANPALAESSSEGGVAAVADVEQPVVGGTDGL